MKIFVTSTLCLVALSLSFSKSLAQGTSSKSAITPTKVITKNVPNRISQSAATSVAKTNDSKSGFSNRFTISQAQPVQNEKNPSTTFEDVLSYQFNKDISGAANIKFIHTWNKEDSASANSSEDVGLSLTRSNLLLDFEDDAAFSLTGGLVLPTSQTSKDSHLLGGASLTPSVSTKVSIVSFYFSTSMQYFSQDTTYEITEKDGSVYQPYDSFTASESVGNMTIPITKKINYNLLGVYNKSGSAKGDVSSGYFIANGLSYEISSNFSLKAAFRASDSADKSFTPYTTENSSFSFNINILN